MVSGDILRQNPRVQVGMVTAATCATHTTDCVQRTKIYGQTLLSRMLDGCPIPPWIDARQGSRLPENPNVHCSSVSFDKRICRLLKIPSYPLAPCVGVPKGRCEHRYIYNFILVLPTNMFSTSFRGTPSQFAWPINSRFFHRNYHGLQISRRMPRSCAVWISCRTPVYA